MTPSSRNTVSVYDRIHHGILNLREHGRPPEGFFVTLDMAHELHVEMRAAGRAQDQELDEFLDAIKAGLIKIDDVPLAATWL